MAFSQQWIYHFTIRNIGAAESGPIALKGLCNYENASELVTSYIVLTKVIGGLQPDHSTNVDVECGITSEAKDGASLLAGTQNDLDTDNNAAGQF